MTKLENQLRDSLIQVHIQKAEEFVARANIAMNMSVKLVLLEQSQSHLSQAMELHAEAGQELIAEAERLAKTMRA